MALPTYVMQTFLLPSNLCSKMDNLIRGFWWGFGERKRGICLRACDLLCTPKLARGLSIRRTRDINIAFIIKLAWNLCTQPNKSWVKLVRSKYLWGRRVLNFEQTVRSSSWIWAGIVKCSDSLKKGLCITVGKNSLSHIRDDPWLPDMTNFVLPNEVSLNDQLFYVRDLKISYGSSWNTTIVSKNFPLAVRDVILNTPIIGEQDSFVWAPSKSRRFSVRSSNRVNNKERFASSSSIARKFWKHLWNSSLHERHKIQI